MKIYFALINIENAFHKQVINTEFLTFTNTRTHAKKYKK